MSAGLRSLPRTGVHALVLAALLAAALALRLWSIRHGLPYVYNPDEELHFVPRAVGMFRGSLNPGYFENPPALTYLLHALFRLRFTEGFPFGASGFRRDFLADPEAAYVTARVLVAVIGTLLVALVYWAGRRFYDRRTGLVAAAIVAFAFLPVYYSKQALNDVVTLVPITVALVGCLLVLGRGRARDWALAGGAVGVATATKYTAGAMLAPVALAALMRWRAGSSLRAPVLGLAGAGLAFVVCFFALNPFALIDARQFASEVAGQGAQAGGRAKLGQVEVAGWLYYLWTLSWGLGALPALAALGGAVLALRGDLRKGLLLIAFPLLLYLFLGGQARFFARWLLPAYPALAILAGYATVRLADRVAATPLRNGTLLVALTALLVAQGVRADVHIGSVLARDDTRIQLRTWLMENVPAGSGIVVEPFIPQDFLTTGGRTAPPRYRRFPVKRPFQAYEKRLDPGLVARYRNRGYCWVVTASTQRQRGVEEGLENARAYYGRLERGSRLAARFSPYRRGARPVPFSFDLSFNYLPRAYLRPGPLIEVHRLSGCAQDSRS